LNLYLKFPIVVPSAFQVGEIKNLNKIEIVPESLYFHRDFCKTGTKRPNQRSRPAKFWYETMSLVQDLPDFGIQDFTAFGIISRNF